ncbi:LysR substrate-binding domain-containing protein [Pendulispora brunnea]|uniref:LysR substrate-binding domain-containing protein n=1 Tax=Pendulispora brunnea TaxID=2905690 RepID=A0ABZ2KD35_9BACT
MDLHTRKLRYFLTVADKLNFSRAAEHLKIAQQALSKQIAELEELVGVPLLRRTTRSVELTPAGRIFLESARQALEVLDAGAAAAEREAHGVTGTLHVGFVPGAALELTPAILDEYRGRHPNIALDLREYALEDPSAGLAEGWADVAFVRPPITLAQLDFEPLFTEPVVAAVAKTHPLACRASVRVCELLDGPIAVARSSDPAYRAQWSLSAFRNGAPCRIVDTSSQTEEIGMVAMGIACSVTPAAVVRFLPHTGVAYVPISDLPGSTVGIGRRRDRPNPLADHFVAAARVVRERERSVIEAIEHPFRTGHGPRSTM